MAIWRTEWTKHGFAFRLDIIDYASNMSSSVTTLHPGALIATGTIEQGFDDLPIGPVKAATWSVTLRFDLLPSALQTYLDYGEGAGEARNCFILYSDRGTGGAVTENVEFCGVQEDTGGSDYEEDENGYIIVEYKLTDAVHYTLSSVSGADVFATTTDADGNVFADTAASDTTNRNYAWQVGFAGADRSEFYEQTPGSLAENFRISGWTNITTHLNTQLTSQFKAKAARTANATTTAFDTAGDLGGILTHAVTWYKMSTTTPRASAAALANTDLRFVTNVRRSDGKTIGGLYHPGDESGIAGVESMLDLFRDIAEMSAIRLRYRFEYEAGGGSPYIAVRWVMARAGSRASYPPALSVGQATVSVRDSLDKVKYIKGQHSISIAEVSVKLFGDKVTDKSRVNTGSARASRSFNVDKCVFHNCLVPLPDAMVGRDDPDYADVYSAGVFHNNCIFYLDSNGAPVKAHERTRIYQDDTAYIEYDPAICADAPETSVDFIGEAVKDYKEWASKVNAQAGLAYTLAQFYTQTFNSRHITTFEVTVDTARWGDNGTLAFLGDKWTINDEPATLTANAVDFTKCILTAVAWDVGAMTTKLTFTCLDY